MPVAQEMSHQEKIEAMAQIAHEANRAWCEVHGDLSQRAWRRAEDWQKASMILGVEAILDGASAEEQHERWCEHKRDEGWTHGPVKDATARTHPALLPYSELPAMQKAKDFLSRSIVGSLAPFFGWNENRTCVELSPAELEMARDAGGQGYGFVKDGIRVLIR